MFQRSNKVLHIVGINELKEIVEGMSDMLVLVGAIKYFGVLFEIVVWPHSQLSLMSDVEKLASELIWTALTINYFKCTILDSRGKVM